ncbi:MAG: RsmF rRNA methyltransferase first C-terminal domain-containing protein [Roseburia sp.]
MLPEDFLNRMQTLLGEEYPLFLEGYQRECRPSLRLNRQKEGTARFLAQSPFSLSPVPWCKDGFYYEKEDAPGRHPFHEAGVYYIQEASAMAPAEYLLEDMTDPGGERILDLCAAPGGKSTQLASGLRGRGLLVCNEIHPARAKILSENVERMGIQNAMVLNETPTHLAKTFPEYFTRILVDAPCSGEGMFRKNADACEEWSLANVALCQKRQAEILDAAAAMLLPGGRLVYSTCTFSPEENEGSVSSFLKRHPDFSIAKVPKADGMESGIPSWIENGAEQLCDTIRLWPHKLSGEGHYLAVLKKDGTLPAYEPQNQKNSDKRESCPQFLEFARDTLKTELSGRELWFGEQLYLRPEEMPSVNGLKVLRPGLHLGTAKKNRFVPSHALALALSPAKVKHFADFSSDSREIYAYLNGETFAYEGEKGWYLIAVEGYAIGWGKLAGGTMKNHYPKGLRKNLWKK